MLSLILMAYDLFYFNPLKSSKGLGIRLLMMIAHCIVRAQLFLCFYVYKTLCIKQLLRIWQSSVSTCVLRMIV